MQMLTLQEVTQRLTGIAQLLEGQARAQAGADEERLETLNREFALTLESGKLLLEAIEWSQEDERVLAEVPLDMKAYTKSNPQGFDFDAWFKNETKAEVEVWPFITRFDDAKRTMSFSVLLGFKTQEAAMMAKLKADDFPWETS